MITYIIRRLLISILVLLFVSIFIFSVMRLLPSDPINIFISKSEINTLDKVHLDALMHKYGLDKPLPLQYFDWISSIVRGDFGESFFLHRDVSDIIFSSLPVTIHVGVFAFILSNILGLLLGVICAVKRGSPIDTFLNATATMGITAPPFWVAILLIFTFSFKLKLLPIYGYTPICDDFWLSTQSIILPVFCLALGSMAVITRQTRSSMLEVIRQDYIRTARSKGLKKHIIILKHALKNAFIPIITLMGMQVRGLIGGSVFIEVVFNLPGLGRAMIDAVNQQDYLVVQGGVLLIAVAVLIINLGVDIIYAWFDPRIKY